MSDNYLEYLEYFEFENEIAFKTKYYGYYVTKSGKIISIKIKGGQGRMDYALARELAYKEDRYGYLTVCLSNIENGKQKRRYVTIHKIVFETFNGDVPKDLTIDHIDNNCKNNKLENLQLLSREENAVKRNKDWVEDRMYKYEAYIKGDYKGTYNYKELDKNFGIKRYEINKYRANQSTQKFKKNEIILRKV